MPLLKRLREARLLYLFVHQYQDYSYAEIRGFAPGVPSVVLAESTLHWDPREALAEMGGYAAWLDLAIVRTSTIVHDQPFS